MCRLSLQKNKNRIHFGFRSSNGWQLSFHFILSILIGVSLRMTTFKDATVASSSTAKYTQRTSFLISFGFAKAFSNLAVGRISDLFGRKLPHCLGWTAGVVLGSSLLYISGAGGSWTWYVLANIFLGAQQGWTWTTNIFMWMDILGPRHRALASGISNSVGYLSAAVSNYIAAALETRQAFGVVLGSCSLGLVISILGVRDTTEFVSMEVGDPEEEEDDTDSDADDNNDDDDCDEGGEEWNTKKNHRTMSLELSGYDLVASSSSPTDIPMDPQTKQPASSPSSFGSVVFQTCWSNKSTAVLCLGGLFTNLVTSLAWGLVLIWGQQRSLSEFRLADIGSGFTFSKAAMMVLASHFSDGRRSRKPVLVGGFLTVIFGLVITSLADNTDEDDVNLDRVYYCLLFGGIIIGCGIGSVYCVMAGGISDHTSPVNRASAIGVYKLWRDSGYAVGGLLTGVLADASGGSFFVTTSVVAGLVGVLVSLIVVYYREGAAVQPPTPEAPKMEAMTPGR